MLQIQPMTDPSSESSVDLIVKAKAGDHEALERLLGRAPATSAAVGECKLPSSARSDARDRRPSFRTPSSARCHT